MPAARKSEVDIDEYLQQRDKAREARYEAHAEIQRERNKGTTMERAKLAALQAVASKRPGGSLPDFLAKATAKYDFKYRPPAQFDAPPPPADVVIATTLSVYRPPWQQQQLDAQQQHGAANLALHASDTLGCIVSLAGLRSFATIALVCRDWRDAVDAKAREWGVLVFVKSMGNGYGKRKSQLDTPTWLCTLPVRDNLVSIPTGSNPGHGSCID